MPVSILNEIFIGLCPVTFNVESKGPPHSPIHHTVLTIPLFGVFSHISTGTKQESKHKTASFVCGVLHRLRQDFKRSNLKNIIGQKKLENGSAKNWDKKLMKRKKLEEASPLREQTSSSSDEPINQEDEQDVYENNIPEGLILDPAKARAIYDAVLKKVEEYITPILLEKMFSHLDLHTQHQLNQQELWRYQELGAFVLENTITGQFRALTFATGTKCIIGENLSLEGDTLFDCHAEILARRALKAYLMEEISSILANNLSDHDDFILYASEHGFALKEHLKIHLYISSPPCGDSRIFNFVEKKRIERNKISRGLLRYKIEKGQGTVPTNVQYISCWDAFLASEDRIRVMSCSDKVAMWNFLGVQGSLLSNFLQPIYIDSLVVK